MAFRLSPSDFPDDCPPPQAEPGSRDYYRVTKANPPTTNDFISAYHDNRVHADRQIERGLRSHCETLGLSVFSDRDDAIRMARQIPKLGAHIAMVTLTEASGVILATGGQFDSHHTWWLRPDCVPETLATSVVPVEAS